MAVVLPHFTMCKQLLEWLERRQQPLPLKIIAWLFGKGQVGQARTAASVGDRQEIAHLHGLQRDHATGTAHDTPLLHTCNSGILLMCDAQAGSRTPIRACSPGASLHMPAGAAARPAAACSGTSCCAEPLHLCHPGTRPYRCSTVSRQYVCWAAFAAPATSASAFTRQHRAVTASDMRRRPKQSTTAQTDGGKTG